jgi:hypothetical protein
MQNHNIPRLALVGELGSRPSTEERKAYNIARCYYWLADLKLDPVAVGSPFQNAIHVHQTESIIPHQTT